MYYLDQTELQYWVFSLSYLITIIIIIIIIIIIKNFKTLNIQNNVQKITCKKECKKIKIYFYYTAVITFVCYIQLK